MNTIEQNAEEMRKRYAAPINDTYYHAETPAQVINALESARVNGYRVRLFYGDAKTGRDWLYNVSGTIGRSMGPIKIPILLSNRRSMGGGAIMDDCIVRLMLGHCEYYRHPGYKVPDFTLMPSLVQGYSTEAWINGECHARFRSERSARNWVAFMRGERMAK